MFRFLIRRTIEIAISLLIVITVVFFLFRIIPGDPTAAFLDAGFTVEARQMVIERFGLDKPFYVQYVLYMRNLVQGDFGRSFYHRRPANEVIGDRILNTLILMVPSLLLAYLIGTVAGAFLSWKRGTKLEDLSILGALAFRSAPVFWTGILALMLFAYGLGWLPHSGMRTPGYPDTGLLGKFLSIDFLKHLALPAMVLTLYTLPTPLLLMRNTMLETFGEDYIDYCRAKGLSERQVMLRHSCRNALLPVVTSAALALGTAIGGQVILEYVFGWPGLGREIVFSTQRSDYPVAQFGLLLLAAVVMLMNLLTDLLYGVLDPRIRLR